ncbi:SDR family oxidoreductase [Paeniglutamicibacter sp. ABSL32-1]|uniref:SDR family NAD(P)-dependent oxidoreductase n=1 Tax=Paeniglutamicibacter quisquiliarum TaxID=2849498 RepID=UPI001C2DC4C8|nr:SDR family oxidoreductase [Paeniglutamicibacter quisquiliarum]MBV1780081.1 SDR family oxidoreductase [Paeniglutamicibacter quisquiliarum]
MTRLLRHAPMRALVTGAAGGLGRDIALGLADQGHLVLACDNSAGIAKLGGERGGRIRTMQLDLTEPHADRTLVDGAIELLGGLDALVNNAGVGGPGMLLEHTSDEDLEQVLAVNMIAPARLCRASLPSLRLSGRGRIVNMGSLFANHPQSHGVAYAMSKGALAALTRSLAVEEGPYGTTVNTVSPGYMLTGMHREEAALQASLRGVEVAEQLERVSSAIPMRRHGTGADVAATVAWLLSESAGYVSGQDIPVNGAAAFG